ncbi:MAG: VCBS repeat-containing protein, partial [candidate division WOR-3 bacterium]
MFELCMALVAGSWTETRPQDFMDGWYDPLLYVSRRLQVEGVNPADSGAVEFYPRFDANRDGYYDLVSSEYGGPNIIIWWGSPTGYSSTNRRNFPVTTAGNCDMADLNLDGWPELIASCTGSNDTCKIYWGSQASGGPDPNNFTPLPHGGSETVYIYDLDKDTYLDVVLGTQLGTWSPIKVFWGGPGGYSPGNLSVSLDVKVQGHNLEICDLNKDGYPDIVSPYADASGWGPHILWGDATPRDLTDNPTWFHTRSGASNAHGITLADLNNDGWLDIVVSSFASGNLSSVYFSDNGTFNPTNSITLTTSSCYGGSIAWDFNEDGWLDLLFLPGYATAKKPTIYFNTGTPPYFADADTVGVGLAVQYSGGFIADFNLDGKPDLFANGWDNVIGVDTSFVFWGISPSGSCDSIQKLPTNIDHHGTFREYSNVYDRSPMAWYESGIFSEPLLQSEARLSWVAWDSTQIGSEVRMYIRTRWDGSSPWTNWREVSNGETVSESPYFPARDIQYRAEFRWRNPSWLPWLEKVELTSLPLSEDEA